MTSCIKKARRFLSIVKALISRILFSVHGLICIWRVTVVKRSSIFWALSGTLPLLVGETIFTLCRKKGGEWKWMCPSVVLYLATSVPAIWFLELDLMMQRLMIGVQKQPVQNITHVFLLPGKKIQFAISLDSEEWCKILEQMLLLILIVGRWLLPKGEITREQLSQLLLVYIGMAADIIELFEAFKEKTVRENYHLTIVILSLWTASLTQFTMVITATKAKKTRPALDRPDKGSECCPTEVISILISVFLQDAPFLVLRLLLILRYNVLSYTNIFFTCKNTLVLTLQIYRLIVLFTSKPSDSKDYPAANSTTRSQSSFDTLPDLYGSSPSLSGSSASERTQKLNQHFLRQFRADSSKTISSVDGADTPYSLESENGTPKGVYSKHKRRGSLVKRTTRYDSDSSPNKSKEKSRTRKSPKWQEVKQESRNAAKRQAIDARWENKTDNRHKKPEKISKTEQVRDGQVMRKVQRFERQDETPHCPQQTSDSDATDEAFLDEARVRDSGDRRYRTECKATLRKDGYNPDSPRSEHPGQEQEIRQENPAQNKQYQSWGSVKDLQAAMTFLNQAGKCKTVVVKCGEQGDIMSAECGGKNVVWENSLKDKDKRQPTFQPKLGLHQQDRQNKDIVNVYHVKETIF